MLKLFFLRFIKKTKFTKVSIFLIVTAYSNFYGQESVNVSAADWSPDGKSVVYTSNVSGNIELYILEISTNLKSRITYTDALEWTPSWSSDGQNIVFISDRDGNKEVYVYNLKTKMQNRITYTSMDEVTPSWSTESNSIYYTFQNTQKGVRELYTTTIEGSATKIEIDSSYSYIYPRTSDNNKVLVYGAKPKKTKFPFHIWITNRDTKISTQLENLSLVSYNPSWSPDGEKIVFVNQKSKDVTSASIYMMNKDGSDLKKIIECKGGCFQPRFAPNGASILYKNGWDKDHKGIYLFDLKTGLSVKLIND